MHKCGIVTQELAQRPIEVAQKMIEFMNSSFKADLQVLKLEDMKTMIMMEKKAIYKHRYVHSVRNKAKFFHKKVQHFKNKFANLFSKGIPSFWDDSGIIFHKRIIRLY